jgi:hypothetical protein
MIVSRRLGMEYSVGTGARDRYYSSSLRDGDAGGPVITDVRALLVN